LEDLSFATTQYLGRREEGKVDFFAFGISKLNKEALNLMFSVVACEFWEAFAVIRVE